MTMFDTTYYSRDPIVNGCSVNMGLAGPGGAGSRRDMDTLVDGYNRFKGEQAAGVPYGQMTPMVSPEVAANGVDPARQREVRGMIDCVAKGYGLPQGMVDQLQGIYRDAVGSARLGQALGLGKPSAIREINR